MVRYANFSRRSGITAYEIGDDSIIVQFDDGAIYLYNYRSTGRGDVEIMKELAEVGQGLNAFINKNVGKRYARKIR